MINLHLNHFLGPLLMVSVLTVILMAGWAGICSISRWQTDWKVLCERFPVTEVQRLGKKYKRRSGSFHLKSGRRPFCTNSAFSIELAQEGVLVTANFARRLPLLIPWSEICNVEDLTAFGHEIVFLSVHYEKDVVNQNKIARFSLPIDALGIVLGYVPAELLHKENISELLKDRLRQSQNPT
jgi:hypothetical protein